jgi:hypothetical protein
MREATYAAIDGVGVGTSLHYIDPATKLMGALKPEAIIEALQVRDEAANEPFGRCSRLLARMDRMHANAGLGEVEEHFRMLLFESLRREDVDRALKVVQGLAQAQAVKPDYDIEFWSWVGGQGRAEQTSDIIGGDRSTITSDSEATDEWQTLLARVEYVQHNGTPQ